MEHLAADSNTAATLSQAPGPSAAADSLEGLFATAQPSQQAASPPQLGQGHMGQGMQAVNPAMAMLMMQMGMQPGASQAFAPGQLLHLV